MANPALPAPPTLYIEVTEMTPSPRFEQRYNTHDGTWLPPRPLRSNICAPATASTWYLYAQNRTMRLPTAPPRGSRQLYHTYSFYCSAQRIWIYPWDALRHRVGDGTGNRRIQPASPPNQEAAYDSSDVSDVECNRETEDWRELSFAWFVRNGAAISHAMFRGPYLNLNVQWPNQGQIHELLPPRNHANGTAIVQQGQGGMTGEIAVLVALIAYSVTRNAVDQALIHCLRNIYWPHRQPQGQGWIDRRGLVVSIWYERDRAQGSGSRATSGALTAAQKISRFEYGGYEKFVP